MIDKAVNSVTSVKFNQLYRKWLQTISINLCLKTTVTVQKKSWKYNYSYLDFGLMFILRNGKEKPQCVICSKVLPIESMLPSMLKHCFGTSHLQFCK